jgi:hypothetical protein
VVGAALWRRVDGGQDSPELGKEDGGMECRNRSPVGAIYSQRERDKQEEKSRE